MNLAPDSLLFGVAPEILVDCARQLRDLDDGFELDRFAEALGASVRESRPILDRMVHENFIANEGGRYRPTMKLRQLALATISAGLTREGAGRLLQKIIFKAAEINAHPEKYPRSVVCLLVFGSYLSDKGTLGDLDIGVQLGEAPPVDEVSARRRIQEVLAKDTSMANKTLAALRMRKPKLISLHLAGEVIHLQTPYRVIFGSFDPSAPGGAN